MKNVKSLILMLLIPLAAVFMGCVDNIQQDLIVEIEENSEYDSPYNMDDVEYFRIYLYAFDGYNGIDKGAYLLKKGEILCLEDLEPGLYTLFGYAHNKDGNSLAYISYKSDKVGIGISQMGGGTTECILIDDISPTVVKLVVRFMN